MYSMEQKYVQDEDIMLVADRAGEVSFWKQIKLYLLGNYVVLY